MLGLAFSCSQPKDKVQTEAEPETSIYLHAPLVQNIYTADPSGHVFEGKWYLFYHDTELSGKTPLRNIKMAELKHLPDGKIESIKSLK